ncbi:asparaginase [Lyngbya confervoides]|uniref:Asparaginase n=1 Tax=Lyngbya confervoides BDU141951 TaxID=1574623 RepID=A0ABD4T4P6_9CYAN|nr:asparaginase [Lyngbya confervoides]MCM1983430.1 asparaginase [Lyngbya confervoides BDU141951]
MNMGHRNGTPAIEIQLLRDGIVESRHFAEAVVCDERGRVLSTAGQASTSAFIRSALKPFQALAVSTTGAIERFSLGDRDLAIMCGSHQGTLDQVRQVFGILWRCDLSANDLQCPIPDGRNSALEYNCSGKHAGMLAVCKQRNWPLSSYMQVNHPVQQYILDHIADLLKIPAAELMTAHDDCGVPTLFLQLDQMAWLFAQLSSGESLSMERIVRAMIHHPEMVAGPGQFDTDLMRATGGELVSKTGAEGVQCVGRLGEGMGLAIKVRDGAQRAKYAAALHLLRELGWIDLSAAEQLADQYLVLSAHKRLDVIGDLAMV